MEALAASIYDDDEMLCSILRQANTEIIEATIRYIETVLRTPEDAAEGGKTASALDGAFVSTEII